MTERQTAISMLRQWGLEANETNIARYFYPGPLSVEIRYDSDRLRAQLGKNGIGKGGQFSRTWNYSDLEDGRVMEIAAFCQDANDRHKLERLRERESSFLASNGIALVVITNAAGFRKCLSNSDIVLYFGHSNRGRGLFFQEAPSVGEWLRIGPDILQFPRRVVQSGDEVLGVASNGMMMIRGGATDLEGLDIRCKILWLMGCRTEVYYRRILERRYPHTEFVTANYTWGSTSEAWGIVSALEVTLFQHRTMEDLLRVLNTDRQTEILYGMYKEKNDYHNDGPYAEQLLTY